MPPSSPDETPEVIGTPSRPPSTRRRVIVMIAAASVAVAVALVAIPRLFDESAKVESPDAQRKQLLHALTQETATRAESERVASGLTFAFFADHAYPADLAAVDDALQTYNRVLPAGTSIAWYFSNASDFIYCVEHRTDGKPDAYALYASTVGGTVATDHGEGCVQSPADFTGAEATVASLTATDMPR